MTAVAVVETLLVVVLIAYDILATRWLSQAKDDLRAANLNGNFLRNELTRTKGMVSDRETTIKRLKGQVEESEAALVREQDRAAGLQAQLDKYALTVARVKGLSMELASVVSGAKPAADSDKARLAA